MFALNRSIQNMDNPKVSSIVNPDDNDMIIDIDDNEDEMIQTTIKVITNSETKQIYYTPVWFAGEIYEEDVLMSKSHNAEYFVVLPMRSFVDAFLREFPEYKDKQYINKIAEHSHKNHLGYVRLLLDKKKLDQLLRFTDFDISQFNTNDLSQILLAPNNVIEHFAQNCEHINSKDKLIKILNVLVMPTKRKLEVLAILVANGLNFSTMADSVIFRLLEWNDADLIEAILSNVDQKVLSNVIVLIFQNCKLNTIKLIIDKLGNNISNYNWHKIKENKNLSETEINLICPS